MSLPHLHPFSFLAIPLQSTTIPISAPAWWLSRLDLSSSPSWWSCGLCHPSSSLSERSAECVLLVCSSCPCGAAASPAGTQVWGWAKQKCHLPFCLYCMTHGSPGVCSEARTENAANRVTGPAMGRGPGDCAGFCAGFCAGVCCDSPVAHQPRCLPGGVETSVPAGPGLLSV